MLQVEIVCWAYFHLRFQHIFMLQKSRSDVYFLQHENLLRKNVVIRATNNLKLQRNTVARQVNTRKRCPYCLVLTKICSIILHEMVYVLLASLNLLGYSEKFFAIKQCSKGVPLNVLPKLFTGETLCNFFQNFPPKDANSVSNKRHQQRRLT